MIRINLTLDITDKRKFETISERLGVSMSELLRRWISDKFGLYCPNCPEGIPEMCEYYNADAKFENRCMTDSSIGYCILEHSED